MTHRKRALALALFAPLLLTQTAALAAVAIPTPGEIAASAGNPPLIPHKVSDRETGAQCLACHETGVKGAPPTSHPERKMCTQCHVRGKVQRK